jgi:hypothetical protein
MQAAATTPSYQQPPFRLADQAWFAPSEIHSAMSPKGKLAVNCNLSWAALGVRWSSFKGLIVRLHWAPITFELLTC